MQLYTRLCKGKKGKALICIEMKRYLQSGWTKRLEG